MTNSITIDNLAASVAVLAARVTLIEDHLGMVPPPPPPPPPPPVVPPPPPVSPPPPPVVPGEPAAHDAEQAAALALVAEASLYVPVGEVRELSGEVTLSKVHVAGTLRFLPGCTLRTDTIVGNHGRLEIGAEGSPVTVAAPVRIIFTDSGPLDPVADPLLIGRGIIWYGAVRVYGTLPPLLPDGTPDTGNEERAVRIESENHDIGRRGHVMFMHKQDVVLEGVGFYNLGRTDKSRPASDPPNLANVRGRYPCHFHHGNPDNPAASVRGCLSADSRGWDFVNHDSNVVFEDCVSVRGFGAAFVGEMGGEAGVIRNCTVKDIDGVPASITEDTRDGQTKDDWGIQGHGAFIMGGGPLAIDGLVVDGCAGIAVVHMAIEQTNSGFKMVDVPVGRLKGADYKTTTDYLAGDGKWLYPAYYRPGTIPSTQIPMVVRRLTVRNHRKTADPNGLGMLPWTVQNPIYHTGRSVIEDARLDGTSIMSGYSNRTDYRRVKAMGTPASPAGAAFSHTGVVIDHVYEDCEVIGWGMGLQAPTEGLENVVRGGKWANLCDFFFTNQANPGHPGRKIVVENPTFLPLDVDPAMFPVNVSFNGRNLPPGRWNYACVMWFVWIDIEKIKAGSASDPWAPGIFDWKGTLGHDSIRVPHTVTGEPVYIHPYEVCRDYPLDGLPIADDIRQGCATSGELYDKTGYALWGTVPVAGQAMPGLYGQWSTEPAKVIEEPKIPGVM